MEESPIQPIQVLHPKPGPLIKRVAGHAAWVRPFIIAEWVCDWIACALSRWAFVAVLQYIGTFSILVGVIYYFAEAPDRVKQKHYQAWQVINTAQGKGGAGGRIEALMELNRDGQPLVGVDVSKAFLEGIDLRRASMRRADLSEADLLGSNLAGADIHDADLSSANFREANLQGVNLSDDDISEADLNGADLQRADLRDTNLENTDLRGADLKGVQWEGADLKGAAIFGIKNAPPGFIEAALKMGATTKPDAGDSTQPQ